LIVPAPHIEVRRSQQLSAAGEQYVVDEHGNRVAVILPLQEYEQLQEDLHDLAVVAERREEPAIEFSKFKKRYEQ
jgi:PHD/YefM family antitoxin component YafN of YafNO toxin-antitoxin module